MAAGGRAVLGIGSLLGVSSAASSRHWNKTGNVQFANGAVKDKTCRIDQKSRPLERFNSKCTPCGKIEASAVLRSATTSVVSTEKTLQLPIDYYQILGVESHFMSDAVVRAYEARASNPPNEGYSPEALKARQEILKAACDTLADPDFRGEYNKGLVEDESATIVVEVPWSKVPGALCLLQEVGEVDIVVQVGTALLDEHLEKPHHQDIVLAMALSYVELSREAMAETPPSVVRSCDLLNAALRLLQSEGGGLASGLQEQIYETLEEITPRCVLELLALPLDDKHKAQRDEGLQEVRNVLWAAGEGGLMAPIGGFTREQFMKEAFSRMTAAEQVGLFTETPSNIPAERDEVYSAALAHVAEGFKKKKPELIQEAATLFLQLQQSYLGQQQQQQLSDAERDVMLGRGLCALLLGEVDKCKTLLGLEDADAPFRCPSVVEFVVSNSASVGDGDGDGDGDKEERDDLLPGLCKLLESWLSEEVYRSYRDTSEMQVKLSDYFDDEDVVRYLESIESGASSSAAAIARIGSDALQTVKSTFHKVFPRSKMNEEYPPQDLPVGEYSPAPTEYPPKKRRGLTGVQIACVGAAFGGLVMAAAAFLPLQNGFFKLRPLFSAAVSSSKGAVKMDAKLAEELIRKWQMSKAKALGVSHSIGQMQEILEGEMLRSWRKRAVEIAEKGWYWEYELKGLSVESVTVSEDGKRASVEATIEEVAELIDTKHPQHNDVYTTSYMTRYEFEYGNNGWKISGGAVLQT